MITTGKKNNRKDMEIDCNPDFDRGQFDKLSNSGLEIQNQIFQAGKLAAVRAFYKSELQKNTTPSKLHESKQINIELGYIYIGHEVDVSYFTPKNCIRRK